MRGLSHLCASVSVRCAQDQSSFTGVGSIVGAAYIEAAMCQGCGTCAAECPAQAIQLMHYRDAEMLPKIDALFGQEIVLATEPLRL